VRKGKEPNPLVQVSVQDVTRESKVVWGSSAPVWEDSFRFFLHDPRSQDVDFQVSLAIFPLFSPFSTLFPLFSGSGPGGLLHLKLVLRVLFPEPPEPREAPPGQEETPEGGGGSTSEGPPERPSRANPDPRFGTERVVRIHLLEAQDLVAKDQRLGGMIRGRSDPYAKVRAGGAAFRSRVIKEELNPRWNESYEVIVYDIPGQDVEFELFDKDIDKDDFLGRWVSPIAPGVSPCALGVSPSVPGFSLHPRGLSRCDPRPISPQVLHTNALLRPPRGPELSAALLGVFVDRGADLPLRKGSKPPCAFVTLSVGDVTHSTKSCGPSVEPVWDEGFSFLIRRPHVETLELQVKDAGGPGLGSLSLSLSPLLAQPMDGWVTLPGGAQLLLRAQLGVLVSQQVEDSAVPAVPEGGDTEQGQEEEKEEKEKEEDEDEEPGAGGLRQRRPPADRFEWELSREEAERRRLEATVKSTLNFVTREKEALGKLQLDLAQVDLSQGEPR
ncbi:hypothetical protein HGM15179_017806, partial [Zosterops borbonicus]